MDTKDKELLLKDLCARLPYGVKVKFGSNPIEELTEQERFDDGFQEGVASVKPAEWSEEDETAFGDLMWCIEQARKSAKDENDMGNVWFAENWVKNRLKSLRPQPKQDVLPSLSEKEIICLKRALDYLRKEHGRYGGEDFTNEIVVLEWLITHPILVYSSQPHWKPSEEQKGALDYAYCELFKRKDVGHNILGPLSQLCDDLKKQL